MKFTPTVISDVLIVEPRVHRDDRGFFMETWHAGKFRHAGLDLEFLQDNHSRSGRNTLRGLHYQIHHAQGKLVRAVAGEIYDVAVDLRRSSATFGRWVGVSLSAENRLQLWIPPGFAHGFCVTSDAADVVYKCTELYSPEDERTLRWDDPTVHIRWPLGSEPPRLSPKDAAGGLLGTLPTFA